MELHEVVPAKEQPSLESLNAFTGPAWRPFGCEQVSQKESGPSHERNRGNPEGASMGGPEQVTQIGLRLPVDVTCALSTTTLTSFGGSDQSSQGYAEVAHPGTSLARLARVQTTRV
jgi:hypothetical protein